MQEEPNGDGKVTPNRGRPPHAPNEKKQPHNMALSAEAWKNLEEISRAMGTGSVSKLVENIGLGKIDVNWNSEEGKKLNAEQKSQKWQDQKEEAANAFWAAQYLQCEIDR